MAFTVCSFSKISKGSTDFWAFVPAESDLAFFLKLSKIQEQANKNVEKQILMLDAIIKMVVAGGRGVDHGEFMSFETTLLSKGQELYFVFFLHQSRDLSFSQDCKKGSLQHQDDLKKL